MEATPMTIAEHLLLLLEIERQTPRKCKPLVWPRQWQAWKQRLVSRLSLSRVFSLNGFQKVVAVYGTEMTLLWKVGI